ncbi:hypothetical protein CTAYLR_009695 [Chrysophaeum taylorii]|uniref:Translin-associated factor X-interacting protein 1 N-terminal domain-containing protein n=1 Tax=Chrysophaeum taylorii TaxID=2483200 RepID=A0AAD7XFJ1_9STRA|nr:hypothetical protein CTAYLR_009695 [Chrysophaeum taylorii]
MKQLPPELRHVDARHLEELTRYIERELKARGCEDAGLPSLARMAVFEEAMDRLLARCYAYRPFLEIYRREQARLRKVYVDRAAEIPALRVRAEALQAKADTKLEFELQAAVATVSELEKKIAELEGAVLASAEQVTTIQTQKLEAEEACKKEVDEVRDLRRSQAMLTSGLSRLEEERDRAVQLEATYKAEVLSLRVALDKEKCESERLRGHINELEILRLEERRKLVSEMEERLNLVTQELEDEREAHRTLLHRTVGTPTAPTPPPHGASGSSRCVSSASAATTSDEDRRSTQISPSRIDDTKLDGSNYNPPGAFFEAHGLDETVPMYLRFDGRVKNWAISKRETEKMINDIWSAKEAAEKEPSTPRVPLSSYLYTYLVGRFQSHVLAVEWAYNLLDGLNRYIADSDCSLFLKILAGDIPEEIRMDQLTMLVEVLQAMEREDKALNQGQASGTLTVAAAMGALKRLLRAKSEKNIVRLRRQLVLEVQDDPRNLVDYRSLLQSDEDGNQSDFCELLREQHVEEILEFSDHIASRVREVHAIYIMNNPDVEDKAKMPLGMFRNAITMADPNKSHDDVKVYLACGACCGPENVAELEQQKFGCVVETFLKGLCKCLLKPSPPTSCTVGAPS